MPVSQLCAGNCLCRSEPHFQPDSALDDAVPWKQGIAPECVHSINALVAKVARLLRVACQRS